MHLGVICLSIKHFNYIQQEILDMIVQINTDTNRRCLHGLKFPEKEAFMTAYTWRMHKLCKKRKVGI